MKATLALVPSRLERLSSGMSPTGRHMRVFFAVCKHKHIPQPLYIRSNHDNVDWCCIQDSPIRPNYLALWAGKHARGSVLSFSTSVSLTRRSRQIGRAHV